MKTRRARIKLKTYRTASVNSASQKRDFVKVGFFIINKSQTPQNRYCCVHLCDQKGSTGPNSEKVGFFSIPIEEHLREQWLQAVRRELGKHFSVSDSTKVRSLHFKDENLKKKLGIGRLTYVGRAVSSVFACAHLCKVQEPIMFADDTTIFTVSDKIYKYI